jgi:hypothetical protein
MASESATNSSIHSHFPGSKWNLRPLTLRVPKSMTLSIVHKVRPKRFQTSSLPTSVLPGNVIKKISIDDNLQFKLISSLFIWQVLMEMLACGIKVVLLRARQVQNGSMSGEKRAWWYRYRGSCKLLNFRSVPTGSDRRKGPATYWI